jgi:hypothetical protein
MRSLLLTVSLILSLLAPACERANPPGAQHDAGPVQPFDDAGLAVPDARMPRPGAGPLDPDQMIECDRESFILSKNPTTGRVIGRSGYVAATWPEKELPQFAWICTPEAISFLTCGTLGPAECELVGPILEYKCVNTTWYVDDNGGHFAYCGYWAETDQDEDGVFEPSYPQDYRNAYLAIIR